MAGNPTTSKKLVVTNGVQYYGTGLKGVQKAMSTRYLESSIVVSIHSTLPENMQSTGSKYDYKSGLEIYLKAKAAKTLAKVLKKARNYVQEGNEFEPMAISSGANLIEVSDGSAFGFNAGITITIYSDIAFPAGETYIRQGENHLNGVQALHFARERKNVAGGDNTRGKNQMKLITAIVNQLSASTLLSNYNEILQSLEGMFVTSMPAEKIGELVQTQIADMPKWEIFSYAVTGTGGTDHCWASNLYAYVMYPNEDMVAHGAALIEKVLTGQILTQEDMKLPE